MNAGAVAFFRRDRNTARKVIRSPGIGCAAAAALVLAGCAALHGGSGNTAAPGVDAARVIADPQRLDTDRTMDARRHPAEFLAFAGVRPGMRVLDVAAGAGYTSQLLALAVGDGGTVWAQGTALRPALQKRLADHPQKNLVPAVRPFDNPVPPEAAPLDLITIVFNYHDIAYLPVDRVHMDRNLFEALKPGGAVVVLDHAARAGSGVSDAKTLHRIDEATVVNEFAAAGFRLERSGNFLRNPADARDKPSSDNDASGDRFALRFVKP